jgi:hypothetical protein
MQAFLPASRREAQSHGLELYATGRPCKHGHFSYRRADSGACVDCSKNFQAQWSAAQANVKARNLRSALPGETLPTSLSEARKSGINEFLTGRQCVNGHFSARHTVSGSCKECRRGKTTRVLAEGKWMAHYRMAIDVPTVIHRERGEMNGRLPLVAAALLADVRSGQPPLTADEWLLATQMVLGGGLGRPAPPRQS